MEGKMRKMISKSLKLSVPFLMGAALTVLASANVMAQELPKIVLQAVSGSVGGIPLMIMANEGLDEKYGFKGKFEFVPHEGASQNFLVGNSDISMDNDIVGVAIARTEGFEITAFYPVGNMYLGIVVKKDSPYKTPKDLIGKTVGHFGFDSGTTTFIRIVVNDVYGFDLNKEYKMVETGPAALVKLLDAGEVEAIFDFEAFVSKAIVSAPGRYLLQAHKAFKASPAGFAPWITNIVAREEWLKANPKLAYAVRDAYDEALKMLKDSNYEILRKSYITKGLSINDEAVLDVLIENARSTPYFTNDWSNQIIGNAEAFLGKMAGNKILIESVPKGVMVTLEDFIGPRPY
jgi:NitT/TauT family transport system substrate-binding protein